MNYKLFTYQLKNNSLHRYQLKNNQKLKSNLLNRYQLVSYRFFSQEKMRKKNYYLISGIVVGTISGIFIGMYGIICYSLNQW